MRRLVCSARFSPFALVLALSVAFFGCATEPESPSAPTMEPAASLERGHRYEPAPVDPDDFIPPAPDVYIIEVAPGSTAEEIADRYGLTVERVLADGIAVVSGINDDAVLENDADVESHEFNQPIGLAFGQELTMGFYEGEQFQLSSLKPNQVSLKIGYSAGSLPQAGHGIRVGVIDTGVDDSHSLLAARIDPPQDSGYLGYQERANGIDDDGDGLIDEAHGHGTFVAGMVAQYAPAAEIVPMRALNSDGFGSLADVLSALDAMRYEELDVLNLSLSLSAYSLIFEKKLQQLRDDNVIVVAAAGNQSGPTSYPASSTLVIGVAATEASASFAPFTNLGADCEIAAPGVGLLSSYPEEGIAWGDGTSFAAPVVSAAIATSMSLGRSASCVLRSATPLDPLVHGELDMSGCLPEIDPGKLPNVHQSD